MTFVSIFLGKTLILKERAIRTAKRITARTRNVSNVDSGSEIEEDIAPEADVGALEDENAFLAGFASFDLEETSKQGSKLTKKEDERNFTLKKKIKKPKTKQGIICRLFP